MILNTNIITDLQIESVHDLHKLKPFIEEGVLKVNPHATMFGTTMNETS